MQKETELLIFIVKNLLDPEAPSDCFYVQRTVDENGVLLTLFIDESLMGRIIGHSGRTAEAIRQLLRALGLRNNARYSLKVRPLERDDPTV